METAKSRWSNARTSSPSMAPNVRSDVIHVYDEEGCRTRQPRPVELFRPKKPCCLPATVRRDDQSCLATHPCHHQISREQPGRADERQPAVGQPAEDEMEQVER